MRDLYDVTRKLSNRTCRIDRPIKIEDGKVLTSEEEQMQRWVEHFRNVFNRPPPAEEVDIPEPADMIDISRNPPSKAEIEQALSELKRNKAPGPDGITPEILLTTTEITIETLSVLFIKIWEEEKPPDD